MPTLDEDRYEISSQFDLTVGYNIRCRREELGKTQAQVADDVGMDVSKLSRVENGQRTLTFREGLAVARVLRTSPAKLSANGTQAA